MAIARRTLLAATTALLLTGATRLSAQQADAESVRFRGKITAIAGNSVTVTTPSGETKSVLLAAKTVITRNEPASLQAVKAGDYVASAAVLGADGKLHSTELRIFPEALRGLGDGQRPMTEPGKSMTNAAVSEVVAAPDGQLLKVKFKGGTSELVVGKDVPVTAVVVTDAAALKPGMGVFVVAVAGPDGTLTARRIIGN